MLFRIGNAGGTGGVAAVLICHAGKTEQWCLAIALSQI